MGKRIFWTGLYVALASVSLIDWSNTHYPQAPYVYLKALAILALATSCILGAPVWAVGKRRNAPQQQPERLPPGGNVVSLVKDRRQ